VIGHDDEFVEKKFSLVTIMREGVDQKIGGASRRKIGRWAVTVVTKNMRSESIRGCWRRRKSFVCDECHNLHASVSEREEVDERCFSASVRVCVEERPFCLGRAEATPRVMTWKSGALAAA
jgi:hypothetical protein